VVNFDALVEHGMIKAEDLQLFAYAEDAEGVWQALLAGGLEPGEEIEPTSPEQTPRPDTPKGSRGKPR
jgi:hypothetical protein